MSDEVESPPDDDVLVARPFEGFERCAAAQPAPHRSVAATLLSCCGGLAYFCASALVAFVTLVSLTPTRGSTGSTRSSHERRLERERAIADALADAEPDRAPR